MGVALEPPGRRYEFWQQLRFVYKPWKYTLHITEEKISAPQNAYWHTMSYWGIVCRNRAKAMSFLFYPKSPTMKKGVAVIWSRDGPSAITMVEIDLSVENM